MTTRYVIKRITGEKQVLQVGKIEERLNRLAQGYAALGKVKNARIGFALPEDIPSIVAQRVIATLVSGMTTRELDLAAATIASNDQVRPGFGILASRILVSNLHKETPDTFSAAFAKLYKGGLIRDDCAEFVRANAAALDAMIHHERDYEVYTYFGLSALIDGEYLLKLDGETAERPQYMFMREAIQAWRDLDKIEEIYTALSTAMMGHATPFKFNACTRRPQLASCFLVRIQDDSIAGIYKTLADCAQMSKWGGGIGLNIHDIRAKNSYIAGTNGHSNGIVPMLRVFEATALYVDQGGGKRKGSIAVYLEPWHADIEAFIQMCDPGGDTFAHAPNLFYAMWIPDLFMKRAKARASWTLFDPHTAPGLADVWGDEFEALYECYEREGRGIKTIQAFALVERILHYQMTRGRIYWLYKDTVNRTSNQQNLGTIRSSNLCCEIVQYSAPDETAVCNLASINLKRYVKDGTVDYPSLRRHVGLLVQNLNRSIDDGFYPTKEAEKSNRRHRPIGIGVMGFHDLIMELNLPFESDEARIVNRLVAEHMYQAALEASAELAAKDGPYETYAGSPASKGLLHFDLCKNVECLLDWTATRTMVQKHGLRNSQLIAHMPTASTAKMLSVHCEGADPQFGVIYAHDAKAGRFLVINDIFIKAMGDAYSENIMNAIMANNGSVQGIDGVPAHIQAVFKTVWELSEKAQLDMATERMPFIDQASSFNMHAQTASEPKLWNWHLSTWERGLKTSTYYTRMRPKAQTIQFTRINEPTLPPQALQRAESVPPSEEECKGCTL